MQIFIKIFTVFLIAINSQMLCAEERLIFGADIKKIAQSYLADNGIYNEILVSEKRAYFPCNEKISITQKHPSSWHTLKASCGKPARWSISFRTQDRALESEQYGHNNLSNNVQIVFTKLNIPKGKVIEPADLVMKWADPRTARGAYVTLDNIVGQKAKRNLSRDTVIKARHILANNAVNKNDAVLIISGSATIKIVTYGEALSDGKVGDMVLVRNSSSLKEFKAIVTAEKKVSPLANIN
ncbi:flagellar basal body P-ring formation chaperone FlgA [Planktomarina temperata]|nr:flagellar basal body P-ring formation chaperone FlgA [Planktomarina temperata]MDA9254931.1 flagellar basal body P-ring formation chaperone FlgA [Planktomarina temperata]MDC1467541.1 flagellar basal body P-ring formation chaperone FlgA [Planktomarina temperata]